MSLKLENIKKSYPDFEIDVSFDIESGKLITLLGPSGCGKTTTLHIVAGFIGPDSGRIILGGKRVDMLPPYKREAGARVPGLCPLSQYERCPKHRLRAQDARLDGRSNRTEGR